MEKYSNISENAKLSINYVSKSLQSVSESYKNQIKGLTKEESNLIALEYIEELHSILAMARMQEDIRKRKEQKENTVTF
jgi:methionine synthase I (cobalamin-dependent)